MKRRNSRQGAIREIVRAQSIHTQRELVDELSRLGYPCTQATVSRDVADMCLTKPDGVYVLPEDLNLRQTLSGTVTQVLRSDALVVVKCLDGRASDVAAAIDQAELPGALGTVAGSDTVLLVASSSEEASSLAQLIENLA